MITRSGYLYFELTFLNQVKRIKTKYLLLGLSFFYLLFFQNCKAKDNKNSTDENINILDQISLINKIDSLSKATTLDTLMLFEGRRLVVGNANKRHFCFYSLSDTSFVVLQKDTRSWVITDTLFYPLYYKPIIKDISGDGSDDIVLTHFITASGGNKENVCFIYKDYQKKWIRNRFFEVSNVDFDQRSCRVLSAWWSGNANCQSKYAYIVSGDTLICDNSIEICPVDSDHGTLATLKYYEYQKGEAIVVFDKKDNTELLFPIFDNALWNSSSID